MSGTQKIIGKGVLVLLKNLQKNRTLLRIQWANSDFGGLTIITDIHKDKRKSRFRIDHPPGFNEMFYKSHDFNLLFEFSGDDNLQYSFKTSGGEISLDKIWINFPDYIERLQRRNDFRLTVPGGTKIHLEFDEIEYEMSVINISLGGLLGAYATFRDNLEKKYIYEVGNILRNLLLIFPYKNDYSYIKIRESEVKRIKPDSRYKQIFYALQFLSIDKIEKEKLVKLLYEYQAQLLRERLPF